MHQKHRLVDSDVTAISSITYACKCEPQAVINAARCHNIPIRAAYLGIWINRIPTHFLRECLLEQRMIEARRRDAIAAEKRLAEPDQAIAKADQAHTTEQARLQSMVTPRTALDAATFNRCQPGPALACAAQARCWRVGQQARRWLA